MDLLKKYLPILGAVVATLSMNAQYSYIPNDLELLERMNVKQERIRYSERLGDTSVFETNIFDENANLIEYKSKENMPIQAKIIFHYDENNFCYREDYYRNHILYQYKEINRTPLKQVERYYSVTGEYKGLQQTTYFNEDGKEEKLIIKRKGHPKVTRKYFYHDNGNLKQIWVKKDGKPTIANFDLNGDRIGEEQKKEVPRKVLAYHEDGAVKIDTRIFTVTDILPDEIIKVGKGYQDEYSMEMYTYYLPNGLNEMTQICIEDKLMYTYFSDYTFHETEAPLEPFIEKEVNISTSSLE
ncbi:hypothetical protein [Portibacter lacus]|uniref:Uncharacterized protein n=1 Tax=Portibacter lacus TaxID=1099794 RepID=A0AA37SPS7_9BACT|nr:hypothetical protein [Portibacter lacus]GLR18563.1 hypothetical protein GCM10007940_31790 [Portibacter lacus]